MNIFIGGTGTRVHNSWGGKQAGERHLQGVGVTLLEGMHMGCCRDTRLKECEARDVVEQECGKSEELLSNGCGARDVVERRPKAQEKPKRIKRSISGTDLHEQGNENH